MASALNEKNVKANFPQRLVLGTKTWMKVAEPALANRMIMLRAIEAGYFQKNRKNKADESHPVNLIDRGLSILVPYLVMSNPQLLITAKKKELRSFAKTTELAFNHLIKEIKFAKNSLRPVVRDAMLGLGIMKTGIAKSADLEIFGHTHAVGQVYADPVDMYDYIGDPTSKTFEGFEFEGNSYRVPIEVARELYPNHVDILNASYNLHSQMSQYDPEKVRKPQDGQFTTLKEFVQLNDYWIPDENLILTIEPRSATILRTTFAETPESGPYDKLYFKNFTGTPLPIPPVWYWLDMDSTLNIIVNKMRKQANSQKTVLAYEGDNADDAERLVNAGDRKSIKVSSVDGLKNLDWPGIDAEHYNWINWLEAQFSAQGNNLYLLGGQNSGNETLGQDQMQFANASKSVDDMTDMTHELAGNVANKMTWHFWSDPLISVPRTKRIEGYGDIPVIFDRAARDGEFWDYEFNVEPYSMQRLSPMVEYQRTMSFLTQWVLPTAQIAAQQGATINIPRQTQHLAKMAGLRGFEETYEIAVPDNGADLNPYTPTQGKTKSKDVADGRTGVNPNSNIANSRQKTERDGSNI